MASPLALEPSFVGVHHPQGVAALLPFLSEPGNFIALSNVPSIHHRQVAAQQGQGQGMALEFTHRLLQFLRCAFDTQMGQICRASFG